MLRFQVWFERGRRAQILAQDRHEQNAHTERVPVVFVQSGLQVGQVSQGRRTVQQHRQPDLGSRDVHIQQVGTVDDRARVSFVLRGLVALAKFAPISAYTQWSDWKNW